MGGFTVYDGLKTVAIPQDQDIKEGDFSINFLLVSEWNIYHYTIRFHHICYTAANLQG